MNSQEQAQAIITAIQTEASKRWGEKWIAELTKRYCELESQETGKEIKPGQRRSQIGRIFEEGNTTLPTLLRLCKAVNATLRIEVSRVEQLI